MNIREHQAFLKLIDDLEALTQIVAKQGIQIAALIETHPDAQRVRDIIDPPPAPEPVALAPEIIAPAAEQITIPAARKKPGPKPKLHGELRGIASGAQA